MQRQVRFWLYGGWSHRPHRRRKWHHPKWPCRLSRWVPHHIWRCGRIDQFIRAQVQWQPPQRLHCHTWAHINPVVRRVSRRISINAITQPRSYMIQHTSHILHKFTLVQHTSEYAKSYYNTKFKYRSSGSKDSFYANISHHCSNTCQFMITSHKSIIN